MKSLLFFILFLLWFITSCKKEKSCETFTNGYPCSFIRNMDTIRARIEGNYEWVQDESNLIGQPATLYRTPCTEGYNIRLELKNDTARFFKNSQLDRIYKYAIVKLTTVTGTTFPEDEYPTIVYYGLSDGVRKSHVPIKICDNYLLMQYLYVSSVTDAAIWRRL